MGTEVVPKLSFEEFRQLPIDGKRYELVCGEVHVTPAPATRHQAIVQNLSGNLWPFVIKNHLGEVWTAPLDVRLSGETALQPDLIFVSNARAGIIQENWIAGAPDLVVEVLSPSTAAYRSCRKAACLCGGGRAGGLAHRLTGQNCGGFETPGEEVFRGSHACGRSSARFQSLSRLAIAPARPLRLPRAVLAPFGIPDISRMARCTRARRPRWLRRKLACPPYCRPSSRLYFFSTWRSRS